MAIPTLLTDRLRLRAWTEDDVTAFHELWGDPRVIWWGHAESPDVSLRKLNEVLARCAVMPEGLGWWAVEERDTRGVVGNIVLQPAPYDDTAELGYHLTHRAWGRGIATKAACAVVRFGFSTLELPTVSAVVQVDNRASHQVAARVGLRSTGRIAYNGMPHVRYELVRKDALALDWMRNDSP